ncbi:MAG: hypothetical protein Kow0059_12960 [Candidatus Sumerlaeia bacterium]
MNHRSVRPHIRLSIGRHLWPAARLLALAAAMLWPAAGARAAALKADIVINGGTFSAPAAALEAARANPGAQILLIEPTDWLGGQATSQGVAAIDNSHHEPGASLMRNNPSLYYPADYLDWLNRIKTAPPSAPGEGYAGDGACWVSREAFDPRTAAWVLDQMIAEKPNITVKKLTVVKDVATSPVADGWGSGVVITGLTLIERAPKAGYTPFDEFLSAEIVDWYSPSDSARFTKMTHTVSPLNPAKGLVVIDASELADVVVLSGATYMIGREQSTEAVGEDGSLPASNELEAMAFVFPFCMRGEATADPETGLKAPWPDFDAYYAAQVSGYFSFSGYTFNRIWTYRRLKNVGAAYAFDSVNQGDVSMQNWNPGNDYRYANFYKDKAGAAAEAATDWFGGITPAVLGEAEKHAVAWYFYMKANKTVAWDTRLAAGSHALNMMGTAHGLAKFPYIRDTRHIIGLFNFRLTGRYFRDANLPSSTTSYRFWDSVGIGNYAADVRPLLGSTGISPAITRPSPFYIPYRALASVNVRNLLAAGKLYALTYVTNSAYRLHPIEWQAGSAAGAAAALMARDGVSNYALLETTRLRELQLTVAANAPVHWAAYDSGPIPPYNGDLVVNDFKPIPAATPFLIEVYHATAVRARLFLNGALLGETTTKVNGRLTLTVPQVPFQGDTVTAQLFDGADQLIDTLTAPVEIAEIIDPQDIVDDDDPEPAFSTTGTWTRGTAQTNKWGASYRYVFGNVAGSPSATFRLPIRANGRYEVFIWYPESNNRATDAPFTIHHADGQTTIAVNQQQQGGQWVSLGTFNFLEVGDNRVVLTNQIGDTSKLVVADAVRVKFLEPLADYTSWRISDARLAMDTLEPGQSGGGDR